MPRILDNNQRIVEEHAFRFGLTDVMFVRALAAVPVVPVKTRDLVKVDHFVYAQYIQSEASMQYEFLPEPSKALGLLCWWRPYCYLRPPAPPTQASPSSSPRCGRRRRRPAYRARRSMPRPAGSSRITNCPI